MEVRIFNCDFVFNWLIWTLDSIDERLRNLVTFVHGIVLKAALKVVLKVVLKTTLKSCFEDIAFDSTYHH
jgi:hypothetical protein